MDIDGHGRFNAAPKSDLQAKIADDSHSAKEIQCRTESMPLHGLQPCKELKTAEQIARLQKLIGGASPDHLECEVRNNHKFLDTLRQAFEEEGTQSPDLQHWIRQISNLQNHKVDTATIIGVVGNTGAGKSSVINAILDEERLVPTNCSRFPVSHFARLYSYLRLTYNSESLYGRGH